MVQLTRIQALFCQLRCLIFCSQSIDLTNSKFKAAFVICCDKHIQVHHLPFNKGSFGDPCPKFPIGFMIPWLSLEVWITTDAINAVWEEFPVGIGGRSTQTMWAVIGVCYKVTSCKKERKIYYSSILITIHSNILICLYITIHLYHHWRPWQQLCIVDHMVLQDFDRKTHPKMYCTITHTQVPSNSRAHVLSVRMLI